MRDQQGFAMVTVLMVVVVLLILGTSIIQTQTLEMSQSLRQEQNVQAHYLARTGLEVGLKFLEGESAKGKEFSELKLDTPLCGSIPDAGSYRVTFETAADLSDHYRIDILSTGISGRRTDVEETIRLSVKVAQVQPLVDYASEIGWFQKDGDNNVQKLRVSVLPLTSDNPVILKATSNKIMTDGDHFLEAPAMKFGEMTELEVKNKETLTLRSDFVSFHAKVNVAGTLVLRALNSVTTIDGIQHGIVYFGDRVYANSENKSYPVSRGYFLFADGTLLKDQQIIGELRPLSDDDPLVGQASSFEEGLVVLPHVLGYSAGTWHER